MRLNHLYAVLQVTPTPKKVKLDAWRIKACCVLLKKKANRQQWPKNDIFRRLLSELTGREPPIRGAQQGPETSEENEGDEEGAEQPEVADEDGFPGETTSGKRFQILGFAMPYPYFAIFISSDSPLHLTYTCLILSIIVSG